MLLVYNSCLTFRGYSSSSSTCTAFFTSGPTPLSSGSSGSGALGRSRHRILSVQAGLRFFPLDVCVQRGERGKTDVSQQLETTLYSRNKGWCEVKEVMDGKEGAKQKMLRFKILTQNKVWHLHTHNIKHSRWRFSSFMQSKVCDTFCLIIQNVFLATSPDTQQLSWLVSNRRRCHVHGQPTLCKEQMSMHSSVHPWTCRS